MDFEAFVLNPATLLVIVFGLVEFVKQFGAKGNGLRLTLQSQHTLPLYQATHSLMR